MYPANRNATADSVARALRELGGEIVKLSERVQRLVDVENTCTCLRHARSYDSLSDNLHQAIRVAYRTEQLTHREVMVCAFMIQGYSDKDIAQALQARVTTVKTHTAHVCQKLNMDRKRITWDFFRRRSASSEE